MKKNQKQNRPNDAETSVSITKKNYTTPSLSCLGVMKEITRYDVSVIVE